MADAGNKVGSLYVDIGANTAPVDAKLAALPAQAAAAGKAAQAAFATSFTMGPTGGFSSSMTTGPSGTGLGVAAAGAGAGAVAAGGSAAPVAAIGAAEVASRGLLKSLAQIKTAFAQMFIPIAVAFGIVKIVGHLDEMKAKALEANKALNDMGRDFREGVNQRISASRAAAADAEKGVGGTAVKELEITNRKKEALIKIEEELAKRRSDIQGRSQLDIVMENPGSTESIANIRARQMVEAQEAAQEQINRIEADAALELKHTREAGAAAEAKDKAEKIKTATDAAKASEKELRKASLEGAELEKDNVLDQIDEATAKKASASSEEEAAVYERQIENLDKLYQEIERKQEEASKAKKELADRDDAERKQREEEDKNRRIQHERDVSRASQQALTDFNNQARASLNELLNTAGIQTGMDKIANILLAIKGSQGGV